MAAESKACDVGWKARDFRLMGTDGRAYALADVKGPKGTVVMFLCNHCPYVKATIDRIVRDMAELKPAGHRRDRHHVERHGRLSRRTRSPNMKAFAAQPPPRLPLRDRRDAGDRARLRRAVHA